MWTELDLQFIEKYNSNYTYTELAQLLGKTTAAVRYQFRKHKITKIKKVARKHFINTDFFSVWSPEMAYVLGLIFADGNLRRLPSYTLRISSNNLVHLSKLHELLGGVIHSDHRALRTTNYSLELYSREIYLDLLSLGVTPHKSLTMKFPEVPAEYLWMFICGFFDGDGSAMFERGNKLRVYFTSGSEPFLRTLNTILNDNALPTRFDSLSNSLQKSVAYRIEVLTRVGRQRLYHLLYPHGLWICLPSKYENLRYYAEVAFTLRV